MNLSFYLKSVLLSLIFTFHAQAQTDIPAIPSELENFNWQTGDVIGVSELFYDWSTFFFEAASGSRFGHVGVVSVESSGIYVFEENEPYAQKTKIEIFLSRAGKDAGTDKALAAVMRPKVPLSKVEKRKLLSAAEQLVESRVPYNESQMMNSNSLNCSEFVRAVFFQAGRDVGKVEEIGSLNLQAFNGWALKAWKLGSGKINPKSLVVTPMSVILSESLEKVYATVPTNYYLSDRQIYEQWKAEGFIIELSDRTHVPEFVLNSIGSKASEKIWRPQPFQ